ncbi:heat shock protein DnaJ domain-containing protein [Janthinobacterium sp. HH01]|uniref:TonB family protein n=1 Tax=Janthinobacterium sp. HH01 TaxID=1198452 RepID=UPI0002AE8FDB|nr:TonB family protein [Janthinobacterium sp. HH01]ELX12870.1 heat shock protein DnaJ domain-containing protein [Janthinobacterium sp. HH01]
MTKFPSHYECLNVTRDAPPEVIRAAYRSLSQKHHPDKNVGDQTAVQMMARLNTAYSVLSDLDQRELYDLQILSEQRPAVRKKADAFLSSIHHHAKGRHARIIASVLGLLTISIMAVLWYVWKDNQSMLRLEQAVVYPADAATATEPNAEKPQQTVAPAANSAAKSKAAGSSAAQAAAPAGIGAVATELAKSSATSKTPAPAAKTTEYERLTAMLKSMGLGLHKLDLPSLASNAKPPPSPAKPAEAAKPAPAPAPPVQAAKSAAAPEVSRAREEVERPADPAPARSEAKSVAEASRASAPPVASISAGSASQGLRPAVFVDARACPTPAYPINAYRNGESGSVLLALLVGNDGRVLESKVQKSSGSSDLDKAARKALSQCRFKPASSDSQAEPTWATLTYVWSID